MTEATQASPIDTMDFDRTFGQLLVDEGKLERAGLERVLRLQKDSGERLNSLLSKLGLVSERDLAALLAKHLRLPLAQDDDLPDLPLFKGKISARFLKKTQVLPLGEVDEGVVIAMADPLDHYAADAIRLITGREPIVAVAEPGILDAAIDRLYGEGEAGIERDGDDVGTMGDENLDLDVERLKDLASEAPVIRMVNQMVSRAVEMRASDIHIEAFENQLRVRYRVDGLLIHGESPAKRFAPAIVSRIKIMARLNIAERRLPQDGRFKMAIRGKSIDLRISIVPTMHGEGVVMRILDRDAVSLDFDALGIKGQSLDTLLGVLERPHGIYLMTGPTGSGKTTSLYAALTRLNSADKKILTVEDPIEYQLEGVNQVQVKPGIGLDFANVLRSLLRQDPDIIMIGEIRDVETAEIAVQAALTGHLVLSTLHTNDAASSVSRLLDMGVQDYLLTSTLNGISAQRLVRTLCRACRRAEPAMPELVTQLGLRRYSNETNIQLYHAQGCDACNGTGYRGRTSLVETLVFSDEIRRLILKHAESMEIFRAAIAEGMKTMYDDGMMKAVAGTTTVEEVLRVTRDA